MPRESFDITYAAHTASCTFLLDAEGICRRIVMVPKGKRRDSSRSAARCVGAQYVASLDSGAPGGLVEMPRVGAAMLFARVDERGRVSLVRTGIVTSFEAMPAQHDPFVESASVETSAPVIAPSRPQPPAARAHDATDPDYFDASDRTQRLPAVRNEDLVLALAERRAVPSDEHDLATAEYHAAEDLEPPPVRSAMPSHVAPAQTLRNPKREITLDEDDDDYARASAASAPPVAPRGMLPRTNEPYVGSAARAQAPMPVARQSEPVHSRGYAPPAPSDVVVSRRRRT